MTDPSSSPRIGRLTPLEDRPRAPRRNSALLVTVLVALACGLAGFLLGDAGTTATSSPPPPGDDQARLLEEIRASLQPPGPDPRLDELRSRVAATRRTLRGLRARLDACGAAVRRVVTSEERLFGDPRLLDAFVGLANRCLGGREVEPSGG